MNAFTLPPSINMAKERQERVTTDTTMLRTSITITPSIAACEKKADAVLKGAQFERKEKLARIWRK